MACEAFLSLIFDFKYGIDFKFDSTVFVFNVLEFPLSG